MSFFRMVLNWIEDDFGFDPFDPPKKSNFIFKWFIRVGNSKVVSNLLCRDASIITEALRESNKIEIDIN